MRPHAFLLVALLLAGCSKPSGNPSPSFSGGKSVSFGEPVGGRSAAAGTEEVSAPANLPKVSDRVSNHEGKVLILEYHKIAKAEARWDRSIKRFRDDLERLYKMGFRPVTLREYVRNKMPLGEGASPLVITFDDANPTQLTLLPDGKVDPECAVGIWQSFAAQHPDFPVRATFFVLPDTMWGQRKMLDQKLSLLKSLGCEIGSHTITHPQLSKLTDDQVKKEFGDAIDFLVANKIEQPVALALPYGISPKNKSLIKSFEKDGKRYEMYAALLVGSNPAPSPEDAKFDPYRIPRVQGIEGLDGVTYWLDEMDKGRVKPYVK